jgi:hypothetical protein
VSFHSWVIKPILKLWLVILGLPGSSSEAFLVTVLIDFVNDSRRNILSGVYSEVNIYASGFFIQNINSKSSCR